MIYVEQKICNCKGRWYTLLSLGGGREGQYWMDMSKRDIIIEREWEMDKENKGEKVSMKWICQREI